MKRRTVGSPEDRSSVERGQALILFTFMMVVFIGFCALVVDVGRVYSERRSMQNAADAGALVVGKLMSNSFIGCQTASGCVNHVISGMSAKQLVERARQQVNANASLLGGYTRPVEVVVEYQRFNTGSTYYAMDPTSTALLPGDTYKVRVSTRATWNTWFPIPTSDGRGLQFSQAQAGASALVLVVGGGVDEVFGGFWPLIRRQSAVRPWEQDPPGNPYKFWSSDIVHSEDHAGAAWKGVINLGLNSIRRDMQGNGYSRVLSPKRQAIEAARYPDTDTSVWLGNVADMSCPPTFSCGRQWNTKANNPIGHMTYAEEDWPRDPQNGFYYGYYTKLSLENEWSGLSCGGSIGDCQVPGQNQLDTAHGYDLGGNTSVPTAGDWVETYNNGGDVGQNFMSEMQEYIRLHGVECPWSRVTFSKGNTVYEYGPCVTQAIYLWEGGQVYDKATNTWIPWDGKEATPPDRVHIVDWWYFSFYENLVDIYRNSEVRGFFTSLGTSQIPEGPIRKPTAKLNFYALVGE